MFSFLSNHIPFIFLDKHENIPRSLPGEKLRFCVTATRLYHVCTSLPTPCTPTASQSHLSNVSRRLLELFGQVAGLTHITPRLLVNLTQADSNVLGGSNLPGLLVWLPPQPSCPLLFMSLFSYSHPDETNVLMGLNVNISPTKATPLGGIERLR